MVERDARANIIKVTAAIFFIRDGSMLFIRHATGGVPKYDFAFAHPAWSRNPPSGESAIEKLVRRRLVIPQSDRSYCAESGGVEYEKHLRRNSHYNIVSVFILSDDIYQLAARLARESPL